MRAATGAESLFGVLLDEPAPPVSGAPLYNVGRPNPDGSIMAAPAAPITAASVGAGLITAASLKYYVAFRRRGGFWTTPSAASIELTSITLKSIDISVIPTSADTSCDARAIFRSTDGGATKILVKVLWDNTTTTHSDNIPVDSPFLNWAQVPATYNETGANGGWKFFDVESQDFKSDSKPIRSGENSGGTGLVRGVPGPINFAQLFKDAADAGMLVPVVASLYGEPTKYGVAAAAFVADGTPVDEPTKKYVFTPTFGRAWNPSSFSVYACPGGDVPPKFFWQVMCEEATLAVAAAKLVDLDFKGLGCGEMSAGLPVMTLDAGSPTYTQLPVLFGVRNDANKDTQPLTVKVTSAPTLGAMAIKASTLAAPAYAGTAIPIAYDDGLTNKQLKRAADSADRVELWDETDLAIGFDTYEHRRPLSILYPGDLETLEANDIAVFPRTALTPGLGSTPGTADSQFTGFAPKKVRTPRYTMAHVAITKDGTTVETDTSTMKLLAPKKERRPSDKDARTPKDLLQDGQPQAQLTIVRPWDSRTYENLKDENAHFTIDWKLEGERIPITPGDPAVAGTLSTHRETVEVTGTAWEIDDTKSATSGAGVQNETVTIVSTDPDDGNPPFTVTIITREDWFFPA